jgi:hypothetical protein
LLSQNKYDLNKIKIEQSKVPYRIWLIKSKVWHAVCYILSVMDTAIVTILTTLQNRYITFWLVS